MNLLRFYLGISGTFLAGALIFLVLPYIQLSTLEPVENEDLGTWVPVPPHGLPEAGKAVYVEQGCVYCHTQVVVESSFSPDIERGWGPRVSVPLDYYYEKHSLIGLRRFGSDLAFAAWEGRRDGPLTEEYLYQMLYDPALIDQRLRKPSYNFLFKQVKVEGPTPEDAIRIPAESRYAPKPGHVVVPKREAKELVAYILSLNPNYALPGAPLQVTAAEEEADAEASAEGEAPAPADGEADAAAAPGTEGEPAVEEGNGETTEPAAEGAAPATPEAETQTEPQPSED